MKIRLLLLSALLLLLTPGCKPSFTFNGSMLDYTKYKTVHVSEFPIRAALVY